MCRGRTRSQQIVALVETVIRARPLDFPISYWFSFLSDWTDYGQMMETDSGASPSSASRRLTSGAQSVPESSSSPSAE